MAKISASLLDNLDQCPCFEYKPYEDKGTGAAEEGQIMHKALETGEDDDLNLEQVRTLEKTRELCKALLTGYLDWGNAPVDKRLELHEKKLPDSFGRRCLMDRCYIQLHLRKALIIDLKTGRAGLIKEAKDSLQLANYADVVWTAYPGMIDEVMVVLSSPRTNEKSTHIYNFTDWEDIRDRIIKVAASADHPFKQPRAHEVLCTKCKWFNECPAAQKSLSPVVSQTLSIPVSILLRPVEELTPAELAQNRAAADLFEAWAEVRKKAIDARVSAGNLSLEGYTRVQKDGAPFIPADRTATAYELVKDLVTPEQFMAACGKPSLTKLVDALADDCLGETLAERKAKARDELFSRLEEVIAQGQGTSYLRRKAKLDLRLLGARSE